MVELKQIVHKNTVSTNGMRAEGESHPRAQPKTANSDAKSSAKQTGAAAIANNHLIAYQQFESILVDVAIAGLQLSASSAEKMRIMLVQIRNPCKTHY